MQEVEDVPYGDDASGADGGKDARSLGFTALRKRIRDGTDKVVTPIMKLRTAPSLVPLDSRASAMGMVPKMSAYIGDAHQGGQDHAKGVVAAQDAGHQVGRNPVVDHCTDAHAH